MFLLGARGDLGRERVAGGGGGLFDIGGVEHRLRGHQAQLAQRHHGVVVGLERAYGPAFAQGRQRRLHDGELGLRVLVAALRLLASRIDALLEAVEIGQHQLGLDRLGVAHRIDPALDVGHVGILETAQHVHDGVDLADVGEELVAQPLALRGAAHQAGDIDEFELRGDDLGRLGDRGKGIEALVGHGDPADIGLDGAERIVRRLGRGGGREGVEEGRLADIGQANDTAGKAHYSSSSNVGGGAFCATLLI